MGSLRSCTQMLRQASNNGATTVNAAAAAALRALRSAGFDTPLPPSVAAAAAAASRSEGNASPSPSSSAPCPLNSLSGGSVGSALPLLFSNPSRCPCGLYPSSATPSSCAWGATQTRHTAKARQVKQAQAQTQGQVQMQKQVQMQVQMQMQMQVPVQVQAQVQVQAPMPIKSVAATTTRLGTPASRMNKIKNLQARAFSSLSAGGAAAAPNLSTPAASPSPGASIPSEPSQPPGVSLSPSFSAAHSGLWAIEEYRAAVQQLNRTSSSPPQPAQARASLRRTLDIVAYIPNQPFFGLHVKNLLAHAAMKLGAHAEERALRAEVLREVERMWLAAVSPRDAGAHKPPLKDADALVLHQALNAHVLAALRMQAYDNVRALCDTWLPRAEMLLFGGATPVPPATGRHAHAPSSPFATGAIHSKLLAEYLTLTQALLVSQLCASLSAQTSGDANAQAQRREGVQRRVAQLARHMAAKRHLQASAEWKLFQGELLLLPQQVHQFVDLSTLLPPPPPPATNTPGAASLDAPAQPLSLAERAVYYFQTQHPELARLALGETNLRRQWYSPLVHALLLASDAMADPAAASPAVSSERALSLLSQCLTYVESRISSEAAHPYLLRTLLALGVVSYTRLGDAIQSEGLFRSVTGRLEGLLAGAGGVPLQGATTDAQRFALYVDALVEYVYLLSKLEWNKTSRAPEARALLHSRLVVPAQRDPALRTLLAQIALDARRCINLPLDDAQALAAIRTPADVSDAMLALPLRAAAPDAAAAAAADGAPSSPSPCGGCPRRVLPLPEWLVDKLQVGSGVNNDNGAR